MDTIWLYVKKYLFGYRFDATFQNGTILPFILENGPLLSGGTVAEHDY